jgi:hypothetical protein
VATVVNDLLGLVVAGAVEFGAFLTSLFFLPPGSNPLLLRLLPGFLLELGDFVYVGLI